MNRRIVEQIDVSLVRSRFEEQLLVLLLSIIALDTFRKKGKKHHRYHGRRILYKTLFVELRNIRKKIWS